MNAILLALLLLVPSTDSVVVPHGTSGGNGDVKVQNDSATASARMSPKNATDETHTTTTTEKGFVGKVTSTETGDVTNLGPANQTTVEGTGGTVNLGNNSNVTITNKAPAGGANITIVYPTGSTGEVTPGSTFVAHT